jgi:hypothetical protein
MSIIKENNGKWSHKRIISLALIIVGVYMGLTQYPLEYVWTFLGSGLINVGMTVFQVLRNGKNTKDPDIPDPDKEEK